MSASKEARKLGFKSLVEVVQICGKSQQTLCNWYKTQPDFFEIVLYGCYVQNRLKSDREEEVKKLIDYIDNDLFMGLFNKDKN